MTRSQMIETVARKTGFTEAQVETTMDAMFDQIADCLRADEKVTIASPASRPAAASSRSWKQARRTWKRPPDRCALRTVPVTLGAVLFVLLDMRARERFGMPRAKRRAF